VIDDAFARGDGLVDREEADAVMVVLPAFMRSRTSIQISSSSYTDSRMTKVRGASRSGMT
jgi:hypothetical protein